LPVFQVSTAHVPSAALSDAVNGRRLKRKREQRRFLAANIVVLALVSTHWLYLPVEWRKEAGQNRNGPTKSLFVGPLCV
jgi:hypothetical protein